MLVYMGMSLESSSCQFEGTGTNGQDTSSKSREEMEEGTASGRGKIWKRQKPLRDLTAGRPWTHHWALRSAA